MTDISKRLREEVRRLQDIGVIGRFAGKDIAENLLLHKATVSNYLSGSNKPSKDFLKKFCEKYGVELSRLTSESDETAEGNAVVILQVLHPPAQITDSHLYSGHGGKRPACHQEIKYLSALTLEMLSVMFEDHPALCVVLVNMHSEYRAIFKQIELD